MYACGLPCYVGGTVVGCVPISSWLQKFQNVLLKYTFYNNWRVWSGHDCSCKQGYALQFQQMCYALDGPVVVRWDDGNVVMVWGAVKHSETVNEALRYIVFSMFRIVLSGRKQPFPHVAKWEYGYGAKVTKCRARKGDLSCSGTGGTFAENGSVRSMMSNSDSYSGCCSRWEMAGSDSKIGTVICLKMFMGRLWLESVVVSKLGLWVSRE